jgi:hypothetical protein
MGCDGFTWKRALDCVFQLTNVAGPVVAKQQFEGARREPGRIAIHRRGELPNEVARQDGNVLAPFAQRRDIDVEYVQAVIEIRPECARFHQTLQPLVRGCDDAEIDLHGRRVADAHDLFLLQHAQQVGLGAQGDVADLIQENSAAVGHLELALLARLRAGERALLIAKKLAFEKSARRSESPPWD